MKFRTFNEYSEEEKIIFLYSIITEENLEMFKEVQE